MAQFETRSREWRAEGFSANLVVSHLSKLSATTSKRVNLLQDPGPGIATKHLGICEATVCVWLSSPDMICVSLGFDGIAKDYEFVRATVEVMMPDTWQRARSGRIFHQWGLAGLSKVRFKRSLNSMQHAGVIARDMLHLQLRLSTHCLESERTNDQSHHFGCIFDSAEFSDMIFAAGGREFQVHRNILSAHSPVLRSMMCTSMSESTQRRVDASDLDATTASVFLRYLYTGSCRDPGLIDVGFTDRCDRWYIWRSEWWAACPDEIFDLTATLPDIVRMPWCDLHMEATQLTIRNSSNDASFIAPATAPAKNDCLTKWSFDSPHEVDYIAWKNFALIAKARNADNNKDHVYLFSKSWEIKYAHFWGRLLRAADKYDVDKLTKICEERMVDRLSVWSAVPMLEHACQASRQSLKQRIIEFITLDHEFFQSVKDMAEFDSLDHELQNEIAEVFLQRLSGKRARPASAPREFADGNDWQRLSCAQLRRACAERGLATGGSHATLVALLQAQESESTC